ncbi:MAG: Rho termination factor N-terminal domain-containing protein [Deltaproteobacteria bacterium]|nr:Rho termination factor N-terminal domain-containing protein [Deltaproteobacteria bacterium]
MTEEKSLGQHTVKELRDMARELPGLDGAGSMKKDELIAAIQAARADASPPEETGAAAKPKKAAKKTLPPKEVTVASLKALIRDLQLRKEETMKAGDRTSLARLRRKIGRLKKKTRILGKKERS